VSHGAGQLAAPASGKPGTAALIAAVVVLGVVVSWTGTWLWNLTSARLPPTLAGLLVNIETVAGLRTSTRPNCNGRRRGSSPDCFWWSLA